MTDNIIEEEQRKNVSLFMKDVEWDNLRRKYVGDSVNNQGITSITEEMLNVGNFEFLKKYSEIWKVEEYTVRICSECSVKAMHDVKHNTFYCPMCESQ